MLVSYSCSVVAIPIYMADSKVNTYAWIRATSNSRAVINIEKISEMGAATYPNQNFIPAKIKIRLIKTIPTI